MSMTTESEDLGHATLLNVLLAGERFWPAEPVSLHETGLSEPLLESLICKFVHVNGSESGRKIANGLCLPLTILDPVLDRLRTQQVLVHTGSGPLNDYIYALTEEGRQRAVAYMRECAYVGPAPVPLMDYVISVEAQAISDEPIRRADLLAAFHDISVDAELLNLLGPAANSAGGLFLYGAPGNGKSTLASRITSCFGQEIWLPYAVIEGSEIVKIYDPAYHRRGGGEDDSDKASEGSDRRWLRVLRPTVVVGGELTMDNLEIRHDAVAKVSEAPLQLKSNCGCLLIDDFGRQRVSPEELLNRWIVPLETRHDYLTLSNGKKIQVPFEQLIIFSTNLDPADLVDEAFLRRIRYRIEVRDPDEDEFRNLFELAAQKAGCEFDADAVEQLLGKHYRPRQRPLRRCHPRDLLAQVQHHCTFHELPFEMRAEYFDRVAASFFTNVCDRGPGQQRGVEQQPATSDSGRKLR
jgi:predicted ATPase with chaperone activity